MPNRYCPISFSIYVVYCFQVDQVFLSSSLFKSNVLRFSSNYTSAIQILKEIQVCSFWLSVGLRRNQSPASKTKSNFSQRAGVPESLIYIPVSTWMKGKIILKKAEGSSLSFSKRNSVSHCCHSTKSVWLCFCSSLLGLCIFSPCFLPALLVSALSCNTLYHITSLFFKVCAMFHSILNSPKRNTSFLRAFQAHKEENW